MIMIHLPELMLGITLFAVPLPKVAEPKDDPAHVLIEKVQSFYENTEDFSATFKQSYTYKALGRKVKSSGTVSFKKPGLMRWDYETPRKKAFIMDGKDLWIWTPADNSAIRRAGFTSDGLSTSITFLWGRGKLTDEFDIELTRVDVLKLTPKKPQSGFKRIIFKVDVETGRVIRSTVVDPAGNKNQMTFENVRLNTGLKPENFAFTPPKGADISELTAGGLR